MNTEREALRKLRLFIELIDHQRTVGACKQLAKDAIKTLDRLGALKPAGPDALTEDAARLDWLDREWFTKDGYGNIVFAFNESWEVHADSLRGAIDAARRTASKDDAS